MESVEGEGRIEKLKQNEQKLRDLLGDIKQS